VNDGLPSQRYLARYLISKRILSGSLNGVCKSHHSGVSIIETAEDIGLLLAPCSFFLGLGFPDSFRGSTHQPFWYFLCRLYRTDFVYIMYLTHCAYVLLTFGEGLSDCQGALRVANVNSQRKGSISPDSSRCYRNRKTDIQNKDYHSTKNMQGQGVALFRVPPSCICSRHPRASSSSGQNRIPPASAHGP
jgi:hypothetical protein